MDIEFQCWDTLYRKIYDDTYAKLKLYEGSDNQDISNYVFRQYTGIKDKNDKKVFDGDIVNSFYGIGIVTYVEGDGWFIKTSNDIKKWYDTFEEAQNRLSWNGVERLEIIGNIYEHPHLINKENGNKV